MQELVTSISFSHCDSCMSFGANFQRFPRLLMASEGQRNKCAFCTRGKHKTGNELSRSTPIHIYISMRWKAHLENCTDVCRRSTKFRVFSEEAEWRRASLPSPRITAMPQVFTPHSARRICYSSLRTTAAPAASAWSLPSATWRVNGTMPQFVHG